MRRPGFPGRRFLPEDIDPPPGSRGEAPAQSRADFATAFVLDGRLRWERGAWFASLTGTNLLERSYQEVPGVYMSGPLGILEVGQRF